MGKIVTSSARMVHEGLFVGSGADVYKFAGSILHCARDPWFIDAYHQSLNPNIYRHYGMVTYGTGDTYENFLDASKTAIRVSYNEMALNMVDAHDPQYFQDEMVNAGLEFITERFAEGDPVLVHCSAGQSRGPSSTSVSSPISICASVCTARQAVDSGFSLSMAANSYLVQ